MAPFKISPTSMELQQSEVSNVKPLRIVKRSKTVSGSSSSRETISRGRGPSSSSEQSKGSPSSQFYRPLTVHKKRQGRGTVLNGSLNEPPADSEHTGTISDLVRKYSDRDESGIDPDTTPRAPRNMMRTISAGAFLKSELHGRSNDIEAGRYSVRSGRSSLHPQIREHGYFIGESPTKNKSPPEIPERKPSKSKNFFLRAIAGRASDETKSVKRVNSTASKNTLIRRLSRGKTRNSIASSSENERYSQSVGSADTSHFFPVESQALTDISVASRMSSFDGNSASSSLSNTQSTIANPDLYILIPNITITPELTSVDTTSCSFWVAIEITGILQRASGQESVVEEQRCVSQGSSIFTSELPDYGRLHSMRVDLHPGRGCIITEIVGNLHRMKTIRPRETELILAKIRLSKINFQSHVKEKSDELMVELASDLGDVVTPFLTVQLTYKHTGFPNHKNPTLNYTGLSSHLTRIQTEATAVVRRFNPNSAWSPRTSQTLGTPVNDNPLLQLIEMHLPKDQAREALRKLANDHVPIPPPKWHKFPGSSEETVTPENSGIEARIDLDVMVPTSRLLQAENDPLSLFSTSSPFARLSSAHMPREKYQETDPAHKIWTEMRRVSQAGRRHPRASISADHYYSFDDDTTPTRVNSCNTSVSTASDGLGRVPFDVATERTRIMEVALRNKRSMGADTLRSMAPSVVQSVGKSKGGTLSGLGLGLNGGRSWGWGPPWW